MVTKLLPAEVFGQSTTPELPEGTKRVVLIVGSENDFPLIKKSGAHNALNAILGRDNWHLATISAHRDLEGLFAFCRGMILKNGTLVFISGASKSAVLSGAIAGAIKFRRQVIGVALPSKEYPNAWDALLSQINNPKGVPTLVASGLDGEAGLYNAALSACHTVAVGDSEVEARLLAIIDANLKKKSSRSIYPDQTTAIEDSDKPKPIPGGC